MNLEILELALKKRWEYPYIWGRKQSDDWDKKTNFIYSTRTYSSLLSKVQDFQEDLKNYALNRWYNYWSAMGVEYIFSHYVGVEANLNVYDKLVDFSINGISFDHKTSIYPKGFGKDYIYAKAHKKELIGWLYKNQSQQGRKHLENRLFIVLYDSIGKQHWKIKAEIQLLCSGINLYMENFDESNLVQLDFGNGPVYSDIIWIEK